jgi:hypothetical protein
MSGSHRYLNALESFHTGLTSYPMRAELASINFTMDQERHVMITVHLEKADPVVLAAGLVDWDRTLGRAQTWGWRTPDGKEGHVAVIGYSTEGTPIAVVAGPIPYDDQRLDHDLEPGVPEQLDTDSLYRWLGAEITEAWPFTTEQE